MIMIKVCSPVNSPNIVDYVYNPVRPNITDKDAARPSNCLRSYSSVVSGLI